MAKKKDTPKGALTTTASFMGTEGADKAPSVAREPGSDSIHADPANPPSGALGLDLAPPEDQLFLNAGMVKMVALRNHTCFGCGTGMYELHKGRVIWVHEDHHQGMLNAGVVRDFDPDTDE